MNTKGFATISIALIMVGLLSTSLNLAPVTATSETYGPRLDELYGRYIESPLAQRFVLETGEVDIWFDIEDPLHARTLQSEGFPITVEPDMFQFSYIAFNVRDQANPSGGGLPWRVGAGTSEYYRYWGGAYRGYVPLDDNVFRTAVAHCLPLEEIVATVYGGISAAAIDSLVPEAQTYWYNPDAAMPPYALGDPTATTVWNPATGANDDACSVLRYGGYVWDPDAPNPAPKHSPTDPDGNWIDPATSEPMNHITFAGVTRGLSPTSWGRDDLCWRDMRAIGLPIEHVEVDYGYLTDVMMDYHQFDMYALGWHVGRFPDHLYGFFHSSQDIIEGYNVPGICDPDLDALLEIVQFDLDRVVVKQAALDTQYILNTLSVCLPTVTRSAFTASAVAGHDYPPIREPAYLYVDGFDYTRDEWTEVAAAPWLDAEADGNYIKGTTDGAWQCWFDFEDIALEGATVSYVELEGYTDGPYNEAIDFDVWTKDFWWLGSLYATGTPAWVTPRWIGGMVASDVEPSLLTEEGINNFQVLVTFYDPTGASLGDDILDALRLHVVFLGGGEGHTDTLKGIVNSPGYGQENDWTFYNLRWASMVTFENPYGIGGTASYIIPSEPTNYHPGYASTTDEWLVLSRIFDPLIHVDPYTHNDIPWLATSWTVEPWTAPGPLPGMKTTFWLRDDIYWHDGVHYNAHSAKWSLEFARDQQIVRALPMWQHLVDIEVHDDYTFSVYHNATSLWTLYHLAGPDLWLINDAACWATMFPQHLYDGTDQNFRPEQTPHPTVPDLTCLIGTGPYVFREAYMTLGGYVFLSAFRPGPSPHPTAHWWMSVEAEYALLAEMFHWIGDVDYDGTIDDGDLARVEASFGFQWPDPRYDPDSDLNSDLRIDMMDIMIVSRHYHEVREYPLLLGDLMRMLVETIDSWDIPQGTKNSLTAKIDEALQLLEKGNENGAIHKLTDFMKKVEAQRGKRLTDAEADYLIDEAQRIIDLI